MKNKIFIRLKLLTSAWKICFFLIITYTHRSSLKQKRFLRYYILCTNVSTFIR